MIINNLKKAIFSKAIADIKDSFKERGQEGIDSIGLDTLGIPTVLADWSVTESGTSSAAWLKHLNWAVDIAQGQHVLNNLEAFIVFAEKILEQGSGSPETAIDISGADREAYCHTCKGVFILWVKTQSSAFIYRLSRSHFYENSVFVTPYTYSAREFWIVRRIEDDIAKGDYFRCHDRFGFDLEKEVTIENIKFTVSSLE